MAVCDPSWITVSGLPTLHRTRPVDDLSQIAAIARDREVDLILIGEPRHMNGELSETAKAARDFGKRLAKLTPAPIRHFDERLTSVEGSALVRSERGRRAHEKGDIDRMAAVVLLQGFIDSQQPARSETPMTEGHE